MTEWVPWHKRSPENLEAFRKTQRESRARYRARNEEEINRKKREFAASEAGKAQIKAHRARYKDYYSQQKKEYYHRNKGKYRAFDIARKRGIRFATISQRFLPQIEEFYRTARKLTEDTGVLHVVDHIWPINGKDSCGLHVPWNLRVVTQAENDSKGNTRPEDSGASVFDMELHHGQQGGKRVYDL